MINFFVIALLTFIASFIGTISGFGIATIMFPILIMIISTKQALLIVTIIHWFNDIWKLLLFRGGIDWPLIFLFGLPSIVASMIGALLIVYIPLTLFHHLLGLFLLIYVCILWLFPHVKVPRSPKTALLGGILSGFSAGFFGMRGVLKSSFLLAYDFKKSIYLATVGALALMVDTTRCIMYLLSGMSLTKEQMIGLIVYIPLSLLGAYVGSLLVDKVSQKQFRTIVAVFIGVMGLKLLLGW